MRKPYGNLTVEEAKAIQYSYLANDFNVFKDNSERKGVDLNFGLSTRKPRISKMVNHKLTKT